MFKIAHAIKEIINGRHNAPPHPHKYNTKLATNPNTIKNTATYIELAGTSGRQESGSLKGFSLSTYPLAFL